ncbi:hypothetical protein P8C59_003492 [Phyllachora maydis]|uniref:Uncharacterized protein n=1 Tax=Phyllachora maydis TaxID=1825666 RepID=A0AAD9I0K9_9PEZI|nr:hypothetical protein P8C59_003492 [Phyllachora maydis]
MNFIYISNINNKDNKKLSELSLNDKLTITTTSITTDSIGALAAVSSALRYTHVAANAAFFAAGDTGKACLARLERYAFTTDTTTVITAATTTVITTIVAATTAANTDRREEENG